MDNSNEHDQWQACPAGELTRMAARLDSLQQAARFKMLFSTGLLSMFLCAVGTVLLGGFVFYQEQAFGGFSCRECQAHAAEFHEFIMGKNPAMNPETAKHMKKHLKKCNGCRAKFKTSFPDVPVGPLANCRPCLKRCESKLSGKTPPADF